MKLHQSSDPILQFLADYTNDALVHTFLVGFGDRRNAELRRLKVRMEGLEAENRTLRRQQAAPDGQDVPDANADADTDAAPEDGAVLTARVVGIDHLHVVVQLGDGSEHLLPIDECIEDGILEIQVGGYLNLIARVGPEGLALSHLAYKEMLRWLALAQAFDAGKPVEVRWHMPVKGGYSASFLGLPVFIPHSHGDIGPGRQADRLADTLVEVKLLEVDRSAGRLLASRRLAIEERRDRQLEALGVGDMVEGVVTNVTDFGAFVDLGAAVALLHASQMGLLAGVIKVGATVQARVARIDLEQKKVSLSARPAAAARPAPWASLPAGIAVGARVEGRIRKILPGGILVELLPGVSGLVYQADFRAVHPDPTRAPGIGDAVGVTIRDIDPERQRIGLRLRRAARP